jgi:phosphoribosylanthranilate isomerase
VWIKICGITSTRDALGALEAGADAVGLNFIPSSKRYLPPERARAVADAVRGRVELVGVVADLSVAELEALRTNIGLDWLQFHGSESPAQIALVPRAYKAIGIDGPEDVELALTYPGIRLLVDKKAAPAHGGTGQVFDWSLVRELSRERPLILAGGLDPDNVADAIREVLPFGVDVASGVEAGTPGVKDLARTAEFVARARGAATA